MSEAGRAAITFAERLGVNSVYEAATAALTDLEAAQADAAAVANAKRQLTETMAEREHAIYTDLRAKHYDESQTAFEKRVKFTVQEDSEHKTMRGDLSVLQFDHDKAEHAVRAAEFKLRLLSARMEELGGLLHFYAATKST